jgi:hypothetical protein
MQGAIEFPRPSQSRSEGTGVMDADTSNGTYTPFVPSQTAVSAMRPPFFVSLAPSFTFLLQDASRYSGDQKVDINFLGRQG